MADTVIHSATKRYALITGANKGIGFEICRQLASKGIFVILTSRDERRGIEAHEKLKELGVSHNVVFHQLDVVDAASVAAVFEFIKTEFGRLDILVNNAGIRGVDVQGDTLVLQEYIEADVKSVDADAKDEPFHPKASGRLIQTLKGAEECVETNYYGVKRVTEALIPILQLSLSPRIVNISSAFGGLVFLTNEWAKGVLSSQEGLSEDKVDEVVQEFLKCFREGKVEEKQWPPQFAAYKVSKAALNAYTWVLAKKYTNFCINSICPGYTRTDMTCSCGPLSEAEAAETPVILALLPAGGPSGNFFSRTQAMCLLSTIRDDTQ